MRHEDTVSMPRLAAASRPAEPAAKPPAALPKPSFDIVRVDPSGNAVIAGRAAPNAEVVVRQGDKEIGRTRADADGEWVLLPSAPLAPGARELTLSEQLAKGKQVQGDRTVLLVVPQRPPPAQQLAGSPAVPGIPAIGPAQQPVRMPQGMATSLAGEQGVAGARSAQQGSPSQTAGQPAAQPASPALAILTDGAGPPRVLQGPAAEPGSQHLQLGTVDYGNSGKVRFAGTAKPGSTVRVYVDKHPVGEAKVDAAGKWTLTPPTDFAPGKHQLRLDQISGQGQVTARVQLPFTRALLTAQQLAAGSIVVQPGQNLWLIARHTYGQGIRYLAIYRANHDQIRDPNLIYPGQVFALPPAPATSDGPIPNSSSTSR